MTMITKYRVVRTDCGLEECVSFEESVCPCCGNPLKYRDRKIRVYKSYNGEKHRIRIRRLQCCSENGCGRLHNELPAFLTPYKHYTSEIMENVIDGVSTPGDLSTEDYPCEKTMQRWIMWFVYNYILLEITARFLCRSNYKHSRKCAEPSASSLRCLRLGGSGWLSLVIRYIYNSGSRMPAWRR